METQKVVFVNKKLNTRLAGLLRLPDGFDLSRNYPAIVVTGPMLSVKEQAQSVYAARLTEAGYVTLVFDGTYFGESEGSPRGQELPDVKESDIEGAVDLLCSLPYVDNERIGGLGICGSGSYMSVAGVKEPRLKAITAIVPAISNISTSPMMGFFKPSSVEIFDAVPHNNKEMHVIPEASHFDMYDLAPFVSEAFKFILPFFGKNL